MQQLKKQMNCTMKQDNSGYYATQLKIIALQCEGFLFFNTFYFAKVNKGCTFVL